MYFLIRGMAHPYSVLIEKTDTQAGYPRKQLSRAHPKSYIQRCLYQEQKAPCALPGRDSDVHGICLLLLTGCQQSALPVLPGHMPHSCCSPPHVQANVEHKGNSIPKSTKRFQKDDQGRQGSDPLGPLLITGTCLHTH